MSLRTHVRITGDGKSLAGATKRSEAGLNKVKTAAKGAGDGLDKTTAAGKRYERTADGMSRKSRLLAAGLSSVIAALSVRQLVQADLQLGAIEASLTGVTGSAAAAQRELKFIREESERLGVVMPEVAQGFIRISAAAKGTELEGAGVRDIWLSLVETGVVLQRTNADVTGTLFAVEQMISKGTVTAEELKRQMGDRLPGAFQLAADAMDVTTQELTRMMEAGEIISTEFLPKFADALRERYGEGLTAAMALPRAEINRLKTDLFEFAAETSRAGLTDGIVEAIAGLRTALSDPDLRDGMANLSQIMGDGFALSGSGAALLASNTDELAFAVKTLLALKAATWIAGITQQYKLQASASLAPLTATLNLTKAEQLHTAAVLRSSQQQVFAMRIEAARAQGTIPLIVAKNRLARAEVIATMAGNAHAKAQLGVATATRAAGIATRGAAAGMALLGGPIGLAIIGLSALVFVVKKYQDAQKVSLELNQREIDLVAAGNALREQSMSFTRENVKNIVSQNSARLHSIALLLTEQRAIEQNVQARINAEQQDAIAGAVFAGGGIVPASPTRLKVSAEEAGLLNLTKADGLIADGDSFSIPFKVAEQALKSLQARMVGYEGELKDVMATIKAAAEARKKWADEDEAAEEARTKTAQNALTDLRAQLNLETQLAGMGKQQADTERLARQIFAKAQKAKADLTLEQARIEAVEFVERRARNSAVQQWAQIEIDLQTRLRNAGVNPDDAKRLTEAQELLNVAKAAGVEITLAEIEAKLQQIDQEERLAQLKADEEERLQNAIENYDAYLLFLREENELAQLSAEARAEELIYLELKRLALEANKDLTEEELRLIAKTVVAARKAASETERSVEQSRRVMERTLRGFSSAVWDLFTGNAQSALDRVGRMIERAAQQWLQTMILEPLIRPILDLVSGGVVGGAGGLLGAAGAGAGAGFASGGLLSGFGALASGLNDFAFNVAGDIAGILGRLGLGSGLANGIGGSIGLGIAGGPWALGGSLLANVLGLSGLQNRTVQTGANIVGGGLGFLAGGPIGAILGGVISQALGSLFSNPDYPYARADIDYRNGQFGVARTESLDNGPIDDVNAAGQAVATALNQIAAALGIAPGDLRDGAYTAIGLSSGRSVALGEGFFAGGDGGFATGATFTGLETPEDAVFRSVQFAVSSMIRQAFSGPIEAAALALLDAANSVSDLDAAINDVVTARDLERQLELLLLSFDNPQEQARQQLLDQQQLRRDEVDRLAALGLVSDGVYESLSRIEQLELDRVLARFGASVNSAGNRARSGIENWLASSAVNDNTPLGIYERLGNAQTQYQDLLALAQAGDEDALAQITRAADTLLALDREATSSAIDRLNLFQQIRSDLTDLAIDETDPVVGAIHEQTIQLVDAIGGALDPNLEYGYNGPIPDPNGGIDPNQGGGGGLDSGGGLIGFQDRNTSGFDEPNLNPNHGFNPNLNPGSNRGSAGGLELGGFWDEQVTGIIPERTLRPPETGGFNPPETGFRLPDPFPFEVGPGENGQLQLRDFITFGGNQFEELNQLLSDLRRSNEQNTAAIARAFEEQARATREASNQQRKTDGHLSRISARLRSKAA